MPHFARVFAIAVLLLLAAVAFGRHAPALAQPAAMSPEEAALQFQPYLLSKDNAPAGYSVEAPSVFTAASLAFVTSNAAGVSPIAALNGYESDGLLIVTGQMLQRAAAAAGPVTPTFNAYLMRDGDGARKIVDLTAGPYPNGFLSIASVDGTPTVGDYSVLYRLTGHSTDQFDLRWSRGQIAYSIYGSVNSGPDAYVALAQAIDAIEAANPPIDLSAPQLTPPGDETARLQSMLRMSSVSPAPQTFPTGAIPTAPTVDTVAGQVLTATDQSAQLGYLDGRWQRLASLTQFYFTPNSLRYAFGVDEDATAAAQAVDIRDYADNPNPPPLEPSPIMLGDDTFITRDHGADGSGAPLELIDIHWRHGAVALSTSISGKQGSFTQADVIAFARAVEDAYQHSAYVP